MITLLPVEIEYLKDVAIVTSAGIIGSIIFDIGWKSFKENYIYRTLLALAISFYVLLFFTDSSDAIKNIQGTSTVFTYHLFLSMYMTFYFFFGDQKVHLTV